MRTSKLPPPRVRLVLKQKQSRCIPNSKGHMLATIERFVSGHAFRHAVTACINSAPSGAEVPSSTFSANSFAPERSLFSRFALALVVAVLLILPACSINVKKADNGEDKKVDIETPVGGIHVSKGADVRDTGLPVYHGSREKPTTKSGEDKSANVNIAGPGFGLKVVAIEFLSDDAPEKVAAYYKDQLKRYGNVLECHTDSDDPAHVDIHKGHDGKNNSNELRCDHGNSGKNLELKVGTEDNQHIVSIKPQDGGKGTDFALVYVQTRGGKKDMI